MSTGQELTYELLNLGGGHVDGLPAQHIQDNEAELLSNWIPVGSKLKRRDGTRRITSVAYSENLTSLFPYKLSEGTWLLLVGSLSTVAKLDGGGLVPLTVADGLTYASLTDPWHFRQFKDEVLGARKGTGTLKRITQDTIQDAGIAAPTVAPTITDGGAGSVEAGDYVPVYTFYNPNTAAESNPSPPGTKLTLAASKRRAWTGIGTAVNGQVGARRLYVTLPNQTGEYYFVATINDNFTTTFDDNVKQADLGRQVSFDNGLPPGNIELVEIWRERSWISDGREVFFSNIFAGISNSQGFGEFNRIPVYPDDGHKIRVLYANGAQLMVGKTNAVHFIVSAGGGFSLETLSDKHGCIAPESMKSAERLLFWYSGENVYRSDGVNVVSISTVKIRKLLDKIPESMREKVVGTVYPKDSLYVLTFSQGSTTQNQKSIAYNYKTDTWAPLDFPNGIAPAFIGDFYDTNFAHVLYALFYDKHVYQLFSGNDDFGNAIVATFRGKGLGLDHQGLMKGSRRLSVLCTTAAESLTLKIFNDGSLTPATSRVVSLDQTREWKRYSLSTLGKLAANLQIGIEYSGRTPIELSGVILEAMGFKRMGRVA
jgi:hypothetical protein